MRPRTTRLTIGMRISVIGTGNIGGTLGRRWQEAGHDVTYGSRTPSNDGPGGAPVVAIAQAIEGSDAVLLAVPGAAVEDVVTANAAILAGKVVIDATNRMGAASFNSKDVIATGAPGALYSRAFNTLGWENFAEPPADADLFFAANPEARAVVEALISDVGLRPVYVGDADAAGTVDALLPLWFALVKQRGGNRKLALRVVEQS
jgi:predicted dinucleotide-binding enzyme